MSSNEQPAQERYILAPMPGELVDTKEGRYLDRAQVKQRLNALEARAEADASAAGRYYRRILELENDMFSAAKKLEADRVRIAELEGIVRRQRVWAQVGMHGKAEDDKANADKLVQIDQLVADLEVERDALRAALMSIGCEYAIPCVDMRAFYKSEHVFCTRCAVLTAPAGVKDCL